MKYLNFDWSNGAREVGNCAIDFFSSINLHRCALMTFWSSKIDVNIENALHKVICNNSLLFYFYEVRHLAPHKVLMVGRTWESWVLTRSLVFLIFLHLIFSTQNYFAVFFILEGVIPSQQPSTIVRKPKTQSINLSCWQRITRKTLCIKLSKKGQNLMLKTTINYPASQSSKY